MSTLSIFQSLPISLQSRTILIGYTSFELNFNTSTQSSYFRAPFRFATTKVNWIRLSTPGKVNKSGLHRRGLDDITTPPHFSGFSGSAWGWWHHNSATLDPGQFSEGLWSTSCYSYLLKKAGVPNLIQLTLHQPGTFWSTLYRLSYCAVATKANFHWSIWRKILADANWSQN